MFKTYITQLLLQATFLTSGLIFAADDEDKFFRGELKAILEHSYQHAPPRVHYMVDLLGKKTGERSYPFNYAIFDGKPGVGKSTLALAIAYKLNWDAQQFSTSDFIKNENRNGTAVAFNNATSKFEKCTDDTIIIFDEINHLLMNYDSKHHDTDSSAMSLWTFLDKIKRNDHLFVIGTTNGIGGFPPQVISRFTPAVITILPYTDPQYFQTHLLECLGKENMVFSQDAERYIHDNMNQFEGYGTRNLINFIQMLKFKVVESAPKLYHADMLVIQSKHIDAVLQDLKDIEQRSKEKPYKETESEQRERHHQEVLAYQQEALAQNERQFRMNIVVNSVISIGSFALGAYINYMQHQSSMNQQATIAMRQEALQIAAMDQQRDIASRQEALQIASMDQQADIAGRQETLQIVAMNQQANAVSTQLVGAAGALAAIALGSPVAVVTAAYLLYQALNFRNLQ